MLFLHPNVIPIMHWGNTGMKEDALTITCLMLVIVILTGVFLFTRETTDTKENAFSQLRENRSHGAPCRATWGSTQVGQEAENLRRKHGKEHICGFCEVGE